MSVHYNSRHLKRQIGALRKQLEAVTFAVDRIAGEARDLRLRNGLGDGESLDALRDASGWAATVLARSGSMIVKSVRRHPVVVVATAGLVVLASLVRRV